MTVAELMIKLGGMDSGDLDVYMEGCDCEGPCTGVDVVEDGGYGKRHVLLTRPDGPSTWGKS